MSYKICTLFIIIVNASKSKKVKLASKYIENILDTIYKKPKVEDIITRYVYLLPKEQNNLYILLHKYEYLFDSTLGKWNIEPVSFEVKPGGKPYHSKVYPIPYIYEKTLKKEVEYLIEISV